MKTIDGIEVPDGENSLYVSYLNIDDAPGYLAYELKGDVKDGWMRVGACRRSE